MVDRTRLKTLLLRAIQHNNRKLVHKYLRQGARADAKDADGHSLVVFAEIHYKYKHTDRRQPLLCGVRGTRTTTSSASTTSLGRTALRSDWQGPAKGPGKANYAKFRVPMPGRVEML